METPIALQAALSAGLEVRQTFVAREADELIAWCETLALDVTVVPDHVLRALADATTPQGLVAVVAMPKLRLRDIRPDASLIVVLAEVRDPGNAGTLMRSAAAAQADAIVFTASSVDPYHPKTVRASAGAAFSVPLVREVSLLEVLQTLTDRDIAVFLAEADEGALTYEADLTTPLAFVLGNEAHGIPTDVHGGGTRLSIPMPGGTESLNVAVAGSILLYEAVRQRSLAR